MGKYILSGAFIDEEIIFRIFGISFDMDVDGVFLFVLPQLTVRAAELADFYGFKVIDVSNLKNLSRIQEQGSNSSILQGATIEYFSYFIPRLPEISFDFTCHVILRLVLPDDEDL